MRQTRIVSASVLIVVMLSGLTQAALVDGLIAYWDMELRDGTRAKDAVGGLTLNALGNNGSGGGNDGIGFSIPSALVRRVVDELLAHGHVRRAYVGVKLDARFDANVARRLKLDRVRGARVSEGYAGTPASRSLSAHAASMMPKSTRRCRRRARSASQPPRYRPVFLATSSGRACSGQCGAV